MKKFFYIFILFFLWQNFLISAPLNGFAESSWGEPYEAVLKKMKEMSTNPKIKERIEIKNYQKDKFILIERNGIDYLYRFYRTPDEVAEVRPVIKISPNQHSVSSGAYLFSVGAQFNFVDINDGIVDKIKRYGKPIKEDVGELDKPIVWDLTEKKGNALEGGFIILWREPYKKKAYTRRIDYFSAKIKDVINLDFKDYYRAAELKIVRDLFPKEKSEKEKEEEKKASTTTTPTTTTNPTNTTTPTTTTNPN